MEKIVLAKIREPESKTYVTDIYKLYRNYAKVIKEKNCSWQQLILSTSLELGQFFQKMMILDPRFQLNILRTQENSKLMDRR